MVFGVFFNLVGYKVKTEMMPSSRLSKLSESQQRVEKIVPVKGTASSSGCQESSELARSEEARSG